MTSTHNRDLRTALRAMACAGLAIGASAAAAAADSAVSATQTVAGAQAPSGFAASARLFAVRFPEEHITGAPIDDGIAARAWTNLFSLLDPERLYFTASDIAGFSGAKTRIGNALIAGDTKFAFDVNACFKERVRERVRYVESLLKAGLNLNDQEDYRWKRRKAEWPHEGAERDDLWRRKIENEYIQRLLAAELATKPSAAGTAVDKHPDKDAAGDAEAGVSPDAFILKRYRQYLIALDDNDPEWVASMFLTAFAQAYDPHSAYMSQSANEDFDIEMRLSLVGIGALLRSEDGAARIIELIPGGPAHRDTSEKRLRAGDKIVGVGQDTGPVEDVLHWPLTKVVRLIRGKKGSRVVLSVIPASDPSGTKLKTVELIRDEVKLEEQAAKSSVRDVPVAGGRSRKAGVITVPAFYANMQPGLLESRDDVKRCSTDVQRLLGELKTSGVEGVVLDLRNNGGGSLIEAITMTGLFISAGPVVQVREGRRLRILPDMDGEVAYGGPLVVLVNRLSASASEILAAALQDYGRAIVVGDSRTHGKGTVQTISALGRDKSLGSVKVTCSMFYRINGQSTQKLGVRPDISIPSALDFVDVGENNLPFALEASQIRPAVYQPVWDMSAWRDALSRHSVERRASEPRFKAYAGLIERVKALNQAETVPLQLDQRRRMAQEEKDLGDLQDEINADDPVGTAGDKTAKKRPDLVLDETLQVLAELIGLEESAARDHTRAANLGARNMAGELIDWFRGVP